MGKTTKIEWTNATWNPVVGCTKVSPGCNNCYAERITKRFGGDFSVVKYHPERLETPLHWREPRMAVFYIVHHHEANRTEFVEREVVPRMAVPRSRIFKVRRLGQ